MAETCPLNCPHPHHKTGLDHLRKEWSVDVQNGRLFAGDEELLAATCRRFVRTPSLACSCASGLEICQTTFLAVS